MLRSQPPRKSVTATATTDLPFQTVLFDATATVGFLESESEMEDAVLSKSDVEVTIDAGDAAFDVKKEFGSN